MAYRIDDSCINCGACAPECPVEAISENDGIHVVDEDACISTGVLLAIIEKIRDRRAHV